MTNGETQSLRRSTDKIRLILSKDITRIVALIGSIVALFVLVARLGFGHGQSNQRIEAMEGRLQKTESETIRIERANLEAHSKIIETLGRIEERIEAIR